MVANLPNYLRRYQRQAQVPNQQEVNYLQMAQQIAMGIPPPAKTVSPPQWRNRQIYPIPPHYGGAFRDDIFLAPPDPTAARGLGFDRMGSEDEYWNQIVPRVYGPQPPGARTDPTWAPRRRKTKDL